MYENPFTGAVWPGLCRYIKGRGRSVLLNFLRTNLPALDTAQYVIYVLLCVLLCDCTYLNVRAKTKRQLPISGYTLLSRIGRRAKLSTVNRACRWPSIDRTALSTYIIIIYIPHTLYRRIHVYPNLQIRICIWRVVQYHFISL